MASTYLTRTPSSTSNRKTWTWSGWVKRSTLDTQDAMFGARIDANDNSFLRFSSSASGSHIYFKMKTGGTTRELVTNRVFRDVSAWYHVVIAVDTTQATDSNREKLYVNGEQITSFSTEVYPPQNTDTPINSSSAEHNIGDDVANTGYFDGSMAHVHFIDGTAYDASAFGETDSTTGIWKPKVSPSVTYGTNGFFLKFENSGAFGTDSSGNSNTFTVNGTMTQTIDTPSNVFATFNPVDRSGGTVTTFSNGNLNVKHAFGNNGAVTASRSTLGYSSGKWYWEAKCIATGGDVRTGIISMSSSDYVTNTNPYYNNECYNYKQTGEKGSDGPTNVSYGATYTAGDIIGIAHDADNGSLTFYKNGVSQGVAFSGLNTSLFWGAFSTEYNGGEYAYNFGNGYFGTTAVSSTQNPDDGIGIFEYDVPTGYRALCTKSINAEEYS